MTEKEVWEYNRMRFRCDRRKRRNGENGKNMVGKGK